MDDQAWEFFLNNSPKLVKKRCSGASFMKAEKFQENECLETLASEKSNKKSSHRIKSTSRVIYRDITPISISTKNNCTRVNTKNKKLKNLKASDALPRITQNQFIKFPGLIKRKVAG